MNYEEKIYCTKDEAEELNTTIYQLQRAKMEEALRWCSKHQTLCRYCSCCEMNCDYQENDYYQCQYAEQVNLRIDLVVNGKPWFSFHSKTNVLHGIFDIHDGGYIPENTFVCIHSPNKELNHRMGYVSHPIKFRYSDYEGIHQYYHFIFMEKQEHLKDFSRRSFSFSEDGIICSCDSTATIHNDHLGDAYLELINETPERIKQASQYLYWNVNSDSYFYYTPSDMVRAEIKTLGNWNNYYKLGYIDGYGFIWTSLDKNSRNRIDWNGSSVLQLGKVELWYHEGEPTEAARKQLKTDEEVRKHPVQAKIVSSIYRSRILVPDEGVGWFVYLLFMVFNTFLIDRIFGWIAGTILWLIVRGLMRRKYYTR